MVQISVIVPIYNAKNTIDRCINSILKQSFSDFELILINDGSTDGSGSICDLYAKKDKRIKVIHQENKGISNTRNIGIKHSKGKYIQFIDADDWIDESMLKKMNFSMGNNIDIVWCGFNRVLVEGTNERIEKEVLSKQKGNLGLDFLLKELYYYFDNGLMHTLWNKLYKRELIIENNIQFNKDISLGEDLLFNIEYLKKCRNIYTINEVLYNYYIYNNNQTLSTRFNPKRLEAHILMYSSVVDLLKEFNEYKELNKEYFEKKFSKDLIDSVYNYLRNSKSSLSVNNQFLKLLFNNKVAMNNIKIFRNGNLKQNIFAFMIKMKFKSILLFFSYLFNKLSV